MKAVQSLEYCRECHLNAAHFIDNLSGNLNLQDWKTGEGDSVSMPHCLTQTLANSNAYITTRHRLH
jgi:hypothetical protein